MYLRKFSKVTGTMKYCVDVRRDIFGDKHPEYLDSLNNVGMLLTEFRRHKEALRYNLMC